MDSYLEFIFPDEYGAVPNMNIHNLDWGQMFLAARAMTTAGRFVVGDIQGPVSIKIEFESPGDARITSKTMTASMEQLFVAQQFIEFEAQRMLQMSLMAAEGDASAQAQRAAASRVILPDGIDVGRAGEWPD